MKAHVSRRAFLLGMAGALVIGVPLAVRQGRLALAEFINGAEVGALAFGEFPTSPALWLEVTPDDTVVFRSPKVEMGQGIHTALARLAAAELGARFDQLRVVQADTASGFGPLNLDTGGSFSTTSLFAPLRQASALVRTVLMAEGARLLGVTAVELTEGRVRAVGGLTSCSLGEVVAAHRGEWGWPEDASLRPLEELRRALRSPSARVEDELKLRGRAVYGYDARAPGMLYGAVARPPRYQARLAHASSGAAASVPGVVQVVIEAGFAGVVAKTRAAAHEGLRRLELDWREGTELDTVGVEALVTADPNATLVHDGAALTPDEGERLIEAEFRTPFAAHCALEPQAALVDCTRVPVRAFVSSQIPSMVVASLSETLGLSPGNIRVTPTFVGGGFGRKSGHDVVVEAARLSRAAQAPVHVGWTRAEELQRDYFRPPTHHRLRAVIDRQGRIRGVEHHIASGDVALSFGANPIPGGELGARVIGFDPGTIISMPGPYAFPSLRVTMKRVKLPIPTGSWRGLGAVPNTFALESFVDDLALALERDPLALRLELLPDVGEAARLKPLLESVALRASWSSRAGRALGVACGAYHGTPIANVVEASIVDGALAVQRVWVAVDPGVVLDEDGARAQIEGGVMWGVSATLHEEVTLSGGLAVEDNLSAYRFARPADAPLIDVAFLSSGDTPHGLGEAPLLCVPSAVRAAARALGLGSLNRLPLRATGHG